MREKPHFKCNLIQPIIGMTNMIVISESLIEIALMISILSTLLLEI